MWLHCTLLLVLTPGAFSFPQGAPTYVCDTMLPDHGVAGQTSASPYILSLSKSSNIQPNDVIQVSLGKADASIPDFLGFFIMAKEEGVVLQDGVDNVIGEFSGESGTAQRTSCAGSDGNAVDSSALTHRDGSASSVVTANWTAPASLPEQPTFYFTVVQTKEVFWAPTEATGVITESPNDGTTGGLEINGNSKYEATITLILASAIFIMLFHKWM